MPVLPHRRHAAPKSKNQSHSDDEIVCDICWFAWHRHVSPLITCSVCQLVVHPECYELQLASSSSSEQQPSFVCWACQAIGKMIKFRERDPRTGLRFTHTVRRRPQDCCLCNANDWDTGVHAMHPLFDDYGPRARQIRLKDGQPAWVHTLCALFLAKASGGLVYACNARGEYGDDGTTNQADDPERLRIDDESVNSVLDNHNDNDTIVNGSTHHFAYTLERWYGPQQGHVKWRKARQHLVCRGCKQDGRDNYTVAIQCNIGNDDVYEHLKTDAKGVPLVFDDTCTAPWHPGCARYLPHAAGRVPGVQTVFYYPGHKHAGAICNLFCLTHATDIYDHHAADGTFLTAHFPKQVPVAAVDVRLATDEQEEDEQDDEFQDTPYEPDEADEDLDIDSSGESSDNDDDDDAGDMDGKPKAKRTSQHAGQRRNRDFAVTKDNARAAKRARIKPPPISWSPHAAKRTAPTATHKQDVNDDDGDVRCTCRGYALEYFVSNSKSDVAKTAEKCFAQVAGDAMTNMSRALQTLHAWPYSSDYVGALATEGGDGYWWYVRVKITYE